MIIFACIAGCFGRSPFALPRCSDHLVYYLCACNCSAITKIEHLLPCLNAGEQWCSAPSCFQVLAICTSLGFLPASNWFNNNKNPQMTELGGGNSSPKFRCHHVVQMLMLLMWMVEQSHELNTYVLCQKSWLWNHLAVKLDICSLGGAGTVKGSKSDDDELV